MIEIEAYGAAKKFCSQNRRLNMPTTDPIEILLTHDKWPRRYSMPACPQARTVSPPIRNGSRLIARHHHPHVGAMQIWTDVLAGGKVRPRPEGTTPHDRRNYFPARSGRRRVHRGPRASRSTAGHPPPRRQIVHLKPLRGHHPRRHPRHAPPRSVPNMLSAMSA